MPYRPLSLICMLVASGLASAAPIKYTVFVGKDKAGSLIAETTGDDESGYVDDSTLTLTSDGKTATFQEIVHYGKDGVVTSRSLNLSGGEQEVKIKALLDDSGAKVSVWNGDQKEEKEVPLASKTNRADLSNFWWRKSAPEAGTAVTYQSFDIQQLKWQDVTLKYVGKAKVKVGTEDLEENEIDRTEGEDTSKIYVDDKGDAVLIIDGEMRIERQM